MRPDSVLGQSIEPPNYNLPFNQFNPAAFKPANAALGALVGIGASRQIQFALKLLF